MENIKASNNPRALRMGVSDDSSGGLVYFWRGLVYFRRGFALHFTGSGLLVAKVSLTFPRVFRKDVFSRPAMYIE